MEDIEVEDEDIVIENGDKGLIIKLSASFKGRLQKSYAINVVVTLWEVNWLQRIIQ